MKIGRHFAIVVVGACCCIMNPAWAQPAAEPLRVFACSLGKKSVSVTAFGHQLIYKFGTPADTQLSQTV